MKTCTFSHTWKGQEVELEIVISPADYDVGIMGPGVEELKMTGSDGQEITLTEDEFQALCEDDKVLDTIADYYYGSDS